MAKPEWGTKRVCGSCGTRFYDLKREPVVCPKCEAERPADKAVKSERRVEAAPEPQPASTAADVSASDTSNKEAELAELEDKDQATKKDEFIEDASELGEDEDDMAEVLAGTVEKDEGER